MSATWLCAALVFVGWAGVCFGQLRMHRATFGQDGGGGRRRAFAFGGSALLAAGFAVAVADVGWEFGPVLWAVLLCLGAIAWVIALALSPRRAPWLLLPATLAGLLALVI